MFGSSKGPSSPGKSVGEGISAGPKQYDELNKHHQINQVRKVQEPAVVASRAATDPQEKGKSKPAIIKSTEWLTRAAEASVQKLGRLFGLYGELTPDGTATVSQVKPVARLLDRTTQRSEQEAPVSEEAQTVATLPRGIAVQHSTLPGLTPEEPVRSSGAREQNVVLSPGVRAIYARYGAGKDHLGPSQQLASEFSQADSRNRSVDDALGAQRQIRRPGARHNVERSKENDAGRDISD